MVLGRMESAGSRLNLVFLDACRDNPYSRSFRSVNRGLASMDAPAGSLVAYATAPGQVAEDGQGGNGVYTGHLLRWMRKPGLEIKDLMIRVRRDVMAATGGKQVPWESSSLTGDFYFVASGSSVVTPGPEEVSVDTGTVSQRVEWRISSNFEVAIRSGKGRENNIIALAESKDTVDILETDGEYTRVRLSNGKEGWIHNRYLVGSKISDMIEVAVRSGKGLEHSGTVNYFV